MGAHVRGQHMRSYDQLLVDKVPGLNKPVGKFPEFNLSNDRLAT